MNSSALGRESRMYQVWVAMNYTMSNVNVRRLLFEGVTQTSYDMKSAHVFVRDMIMNDVLIDDVIDGMEPFSDKVSNRQYAF